MKLKRPFQYFSPFQSPTSKWKTQLKRVFKKPPFWSDLNQMVKYPTFGTARTICFANRWPPTINLPP